MDFGTILSIITIFIIVVVIIVFSILLGLFNKDTTSIKEVNDAQDKTIKEYEKKIKEYEEKIKENADKINSLTTQISKTQDNEYLYDNNAEIYFGKVNEKSNEFEGNYKFNCSAYGFYNKKTHRANISTNNFFSKLNKNDLSVCFIGIKVQGVMLYAKNYPFLKEQTTNGTKIDDKYFTNEYPTIAGNLELTMNQHQVWDDGTDVQEKFILYLHPTAKNITMNKIQYPVYTVRNQNGEIYPMKNFGTVISSDYNEFILRFVNLELTDKIEPYKISNTETTNN